MKEEVREKMIETLMPEVTAGVTTFEDLSKMLDDLKKNMLQKLLDKEFEEHMKYNKGSHETGFMSSFWTQKFSKLDLAIG